MKQKDKIMENNIINSWIKYYMIGPMEAVAAKDGGRGWRARFKEAMAKRRDVNGNLLFPFDPTLEESNKIGMESETFAFYSNGVGHRFAVIYDKNLSGYCTIDLLQVNCKKFKDE